MSVKILRFCLTVSLSYLYLASAAGDDSRRSPLKYLKFQCRHGQKARSSSNMNEFDIKGIPNF